MRAGGQDLCRGRPPFAMQLQFSFLRRPRAAALLAALLPALIAQAQDLPQEWAGFASPAQRPAGERSVVTPVQWRRVEQSAAGFAPRVPNEAERTLLASARAGRWLEVQQMLKPKESVDEIDADVRDETGGSVLVPAARAGQDDILRELIKRGADLDRRGEDGQTALGAAAVAGRPLTVRLLLEAGADPARRGASGYDALHLACIHGRLSVIDELLRWGVDLQARARSGEQAEDLAARWHRDDVMDRLVRARITAEQGLRP